MIKATDRKLVVGLEIGTAKVAALVGEVLPDGMVNIIGVGSCPSRGMDKGGVNDLESVVKCVQRAIDPLGHTSGVRRTINTSADAVKHHFDQLP